MKHSILFVTLLSMVLLSCKGNTSEVTVQQNHKEVVHLEKQKSIKISVCEPDNQSINYCIKKNLVRLNKEASLTANFDDNKRIVTTKLKMADAKTYPQSDNEEIYKYYFIVIDLDKRTATPITQVLTHYGDKNGYNPNIKPKISFNTDSNLICFSGSLIGYKDSYPNVRNACYTYNSAEGYISPANNLFDEIDDYQESSHITKINKIQNVDYKKRVKISELPLPISESNILDKSSKYNSDIDELEKYPTNITKKINQLIGGASSDGFYALPNYKGQQVFIIYGMFEDENEAFVTRDNPYGMHVVQENYLVFIKDQKIRTFELGDSFFIDKKFNVTKNGIKIEID